MESADLNPQVAHPARVYDYWLGGHDNYAADRRAGVRSEQVHPHVRVTARQNRNFMLRAAKFCAVQGIRQFLDIGTGIPTEPNLHQAVQQIRPTSRVVYVDNDPLVIAHARALMTSTAQCHTSYIHADVRKPDSILTAPELLDTLDPSQPTALSLIAIMHFVEDEHSPYEIVDRLLSPLAPGSYLIMTHATPDFGPEMAEVERVYHESGMPGQIRTRDEFARFFTGLEWVDPGLTTPHKWRPAITPPSKMDNQVQFYAGVARKI